MPQIEADIEDVISFIDNIKPIKFRINEDIIKVLKTTLREKVFNYDTGNKSIRDKQEMRNLISAGKGSTSHSPAQPRAGKPYNKEYLKRKERMGETKPHKYEEYGFWHGIDFKNIYGSIKMEAKPPETSEKQFDYLTHHEKRRSVLKLTFVYAWQEIINTIVKRIIKEMNR